MTAVIYKITYPNGKIYVSKDLTDSIGYFGSPDQRLIAAGFSQAERKVFTVCREILCEDEAPHPAKVSRMEVHFIRQLRSNDRAIGYNRWPPFRAEP